MRATERAERNRTPHEDADPGSRAARPGPASRRIVLVSFLVLVALFWAGVAFFLT